MVDAADLDYGDGDGDGDLEAQHENVTTPAASGKSSTCQGPVLEVPKPQLLHTPLANTSTTPEDAGLPSNADSSDPATLPSGRAISFKANTQRPEYRSDGNLEEMLKERVHRGLT
ncbi:unnamed protein product [Protopolystoma xenopodis]|uniref:Uncharacterized protein n=1 Tax=Protopolystoma xenopodis TaxID=117903 RepID=A0A448WT41_9PLAT|nr:unnamed protein product [Protopolystoma xenopodis]